MQAEDVRLIVHFVIITANIEKATIKFKVPSAEGYDPTTVELRRYDSSKKVWSSLPTRFTSEVGGYYYFEAETTSFSIFAIVGKKLPEGIEPSKSFVP